ncbi:metal ABC transporter ATPase [Pseudomonas syringae pv. spinaceae]|uniref:Metal ABC transporter ATPase n=1 Tax=Pseudomonas syringae pv. spinaceae TaxID=264459 RepID=A0A0Q0BVE8_PSESX|nr:metal ABC transporter ATPase [Pseudomonas syringae pv. spinaceae]
MVKHTPGDRPVALQVLDDLHALKQLFATRLQVADLLDADIELGDLGLQKRVAGHLMFNGAADVAVDQKENADRHHQHADQCGQKAFFACFAKLFTPR